MALRIPSVNGREARIATFVMNSRILCRQLKP